MQPSDAACALQALPLLRPAFAGRRREVADHATGEERLLTRARDGDRAAFDELARRHTSALRRTLLRITRDREAAADAVQEALTRAWLSIGSFEGRAQFSTWLTRIGMNEAYRGLRRNLPEPMEPLQLDDLVGRRVPSWGRQPEEAFAARELLDMIDGALRDLPVDYRVAVTLRDVEGLSTAEAARLLGIGERALKSRVHRGRMALRAALDGYFQEVS